ncbi:MAG TPA: ThuA domain-containing protein [Candidatus Brocadiia bacterium]|nr:ThuA domain-containing protein [Candidatus Brocadiia bacterium]
MALEKRGDNINLAVIEGFHPFEIPQWNELFLSMEGVTPYFQTIENWAVDCAGCRRDYDALLFYNMNMKLDGPFKDAIEKAIADFGHTAQGLVILHHAILAYPDSPVWHEAVGFPDRSFGYDVEQDITIEIAPGDHPITRGLKPWTMRDETYTMADAGEGCLKLFTADNPKSMKTVGWARDYNSARVFCFQPGHDHRAWEHPSFREALLRGIRWAARKL